LKLLKVILQLVSHYLATELRSASPINAMHLATVITPTTEITVKL